MINKNLLGSMIFLLVTVVVFTVLGDRASAVVDNTNGIPFNPVLNTMRNNPSYNQTTNPNWSTGNQCNGHSNAQFAWVSASGNTTQTQITVNHDQTSVNLRFNTVAATCDSIINNRGVITNHTLKQTHWNILRSELNFNGSVSGLASSLTVNYNDAQWFNLRYTNIASDIFTLGGLNNLDVGANVVRVSIFHRPVNRFEGIPDLYKCVVNNIRANPYRLTHPSGTPSNCGETKADGYITITRLPPPTVNVTCHISINAPGWSRPPNGSATITSGFNSSRANNTGTIGAGYSLQVTRPNGNLMVDEALFLGNVPPNTNHRTPHTFSVDGLSPGVYRARVFGNVDGRAIECTQQLIITGTPTSSINCHTPLPALNTSITFRASPNPPDGPADYTWTVESGSGAGPGTTSNRGTEYTIAFSLPGPKRLRVTNPNVGDSAICDIDIPNTPPPEKPYHKVYGGDVLAGAGYVADGSCNKQPGAEIRGNNLGIASGYAGAGTQLAAFALGVIDQFASAQQQIPGGPPKSLTFANTSAGIYGGSLAIDYLPCGIPFWNTTAGNAWNTSNISGIPPDGIHRINNSLTLGRINIPKGHHTTLYVTGDVTITDNILFESSGSYSNLQNIPSFRLIVKGNIYVRGNVSQIEGLYVAVQETSTNGRFYTCHNGSLTPIDDGFILTQCNNPLTVYGSVVADWIIFGRSSGSLDDATTSDTYNSGPGTPAEKFIYTPEVWLTSEFSTGEGVADSYQTLPPIL